MTQLYAELAIPLAVDKLFTYTVPAQLRSTIRPGLRAVVPFGKRSVVGFIVELHTVKPNISQIRPITDVIDAEPPLTDELLSLARWIAEYYFAPLGEVLKAAVIQGATPPSKRMVRLASPPDQHSSGGYARSSKHLDILNALNGVRRMSIQQLQKRIGVKNIYTTLNDMAQRHLIVIDEEPVGRGVLPKYERTIAITDESRSLWRQWLLDARNGKPQYQTQRTAVHKLLAIDAAEIPLAQYLRTSGVSLSTLRSLNRKRLLDFGRRETIRSTEYDLYESSLGTQNIVLNPHQRNAIDKICSGVESGQFQSYLLYGVTGSGKTIVYIEAIRRVLEEGKSAIVLVPEISLTPQIVRRFKLHFGEKVVVLHSRLSRGERYDAWRMIQAGKFSIVIGPRSAVFAPLKNLGLIVVDEEHEGSYKQFDQTPRYHARDTAVMRAHFARAVVVLGSATPSLESYKNSSIGKYELLEMPERVDNARLPTIEIIDMTKERQERLAIFRQQRKTEFKEDPVKARASKRPFVFGMISNRLKEQIALRLGKKEGIILLQNRRGFAPFTECPDCGYVEMCDNCNITLTYHLTKKHLRCHYCGLVRQGPEVCVKCGSSDIRYRGFGTQRVEEELKLLFPEARILRMDLDTTTGRGTHDRLLRTFSDGNADILLGTQMVAKGLDISRVTLVGVISADTQMLLPDFRSAERTFQLLTQVAGRAGRSVLAGEVIIQTFQPSHYGLRHVSGHDFKAFYGEEMAYRRELFYPPFSRIVLVECRGKRENEVAGHAMFLANWLKQRDGGYLVLGPAPAAIARINKQFRWHVVVKDLKSDDPSGNLLHRVLKEALAASARLPSAKSRSVRSIVDVDPVG
ncbi:MAG TPA: primosomal protein N', partial [Bacteroidota bacterium]|nr:primosomal protein N' [Bacteroidota bacterium]